MSPILLSTLKYVAIGFTLIPAAGTFVWNYTAPDPDRPERKVLTTPGKTALVLTGVGVVVTIATLAVEDAIKAADRRKAADQRKANEQLAEDARASREATSRVEVILTSMAKRSATVTDLAGPGEGPDAERLREEAKALQSQIAAAQEALGDGADQEELARLEDGRRSWWRYNAEKADRAAFWSFVSRVDVPPERVFNTRGEPGEPASGADLAGGEPGLPAVAEVDGKRYGYVVFHVGPGSQCTIGDLLSLKRNLIRLREEKGPFDRFIVFINGMGEDSARGFEMLHGSLIDSQLAGVAEVVYTSF